jgi:MOSC domain-containing protein YiiM
LGARTVEEEKMHRPEARVRLINHMKIVSINVGMPRVFHWKGLEFESAIIKEPVPGRIMLRKTSLDGDRQADLSVHGGPNKAVYSYPSEHYPYWAKRLHGHDLPWGAFGENLTTEGMLETEVSVGDQYRVGSAVVMVRTPRTPCYKLAARFQRDQILEEFHNSGKSGFYLSVVEEGEIGAGDQFEFVGGEANSITISDANNLYSGRSNDIDLLRRSVHVQALPESWRHRFQARLNAVENLAV